MSNNILNSKRALQGEVLLSKLKDLKSLNKTRKAKACGYVTRSKSGKERVQLREFMSALIAAKGLELDGEISSNYERKLAYRTSVQKNGQIFIGTGYTKEMNLEPGDRFEIQLGRNHIKLVAIDEEEEFDDDEID